MSATESPRGPFGAIHQLTDLWWVFGLFGALSIVAGVIAIVNPGLSLLAVALLFGIYLLFVGAIDIAEAITGDAYHRVLSALIGALALIAGLICIRRPGESVLALVVTLGIYLVVVGVINFVTAFEAREDRTLRIVLGLADAVLGIVILAWPGLGLATLAVLFGIGLVVRGAVAIGQAVTMRRIRKATEVPSHISPAGA